MKSDFEKDLLPEDASPHTDFYMTLNKKLNEIMLNNKKN
jgi:hypothetical protein